MKFKVESKHTELREDGLPLEPGEAIELSKKEIEESEQYKRLIKEGRLIPIKGDAEILADPGEHSVEEVLEVFERSSPEQIGAAQQLEAGGKARKGIADFSIPDNKTEQEKTQ